MKKSTKKKLWKGTAAAAKGLGKVIFVYPAKSIWRGSRFTYNKIKEANLKRREIQEKKTQEQQRPKINAQYSPFTEIKLMQGNYPDFEDKLLTNKSTIGIILGARGTGKSAIGMRLLENIAVKTEKKLYALGFKAESLPSWIKVVSSIEEIENNSALLIDEGGIEFSSRESMSNANKLLSEILLIARHKDLSVMFITQNSSNLEINAIRQADYLLLKPSSLLQKDFERKKIKEMYEEVQKEFDELKDTTGLTYIYADSYRGFISNSLPSFWSEGVSKGYAKK